MRLLCSASGGEEQRFQLKQILCCYSDFTFKYSRNHNTQLLSLSYVYLILSDDDSIIRIFVQINILQRRASNVVFIGHVSVTISYSFPCLTTETVKYNNENSLIENLAASKYNMGQQRGKQMK